MRTSTAKERRKSSAQGSLCLGCWEGGGRAGAGDGAGGAEGSGGVGTTLRLVADEELGVLSREDVVRHHDQRVLIAHAAAEREHQSRLPAPHRAADPDRERAAVEVATMARVALRELSGVAPLRVFVRMIVIVFFVHAFLRIETASNRVGHASCRTSRAAAPSGPAPPRPCRRKVRARSIASNATRASAEGSATKRASRTPYVDRGAGDGAACETDSEGLPRDRFCERGEAGRDFTAGSLYVWSNKLGRRDAPSGKRDVQLARVIRRRIEAATDAPRSDPSVPLVLIEVAGLQVFLAPGVDRATLETVLCAVRSTAGALR